MSKSKENEFDDIIERAESYRKELAKSELRDKNKDEIKGSLNFGGKPAIGDNLFLAGFTITLEGFNRLDGKYIVESSNHSLSSSGYACGIEIRKCLNGY